MRVLMLAGSMLLGAAAAHAASSIDEMQTNNTERSIEHIVCEACGPVKSKVVEEEPEITLKPGEQKIEVREVDGVKKIYRTEAWFGGSPVVVVSKAPLGASDTVTADKAADPTDPTATVEIDPNATTSVNADMGSAPMHAAEKVEIKPLDTSNLQLRLK